MKNTLIIESGSTKTDWVVMTTEGDYRFETLGINPAANPHIYDLQSEHKDLLGFADSIKEIHYFGAGIIDNRTRTIVKDWLSRYFKKAQNIQIESDILGAAKATAGDHKGIICILGTGSNSCLYDGSEIIDNIPALGFALSNEGGGSKIGGQLLKAYYYRQLPNEIKSALENQYSLSKSNVIEELYTKANPTAYLAGFAKFINKVDDKKWRNDFLFPIFQEFIDIRIKQYSEYLTHDLYFVGSIAYFYADVIRDVLQFNSLTCASIVRKPIDGLVEYFK